MTEPLDVLPLGWFFVVAIAVALLALESGYRLGQWRHAHGTGEKDAPIGAMVGAILGLLAFMLAFTFSPAASRPFSTRRTRLEPRICARDCYRNLNSRKLQSCSASMSIFASTEWRKEELRKLSHDRKHCTRRSGSEPLQLRRRIRTQS